MANLLVVLTPCLILVVAFVTSEVSAGTPTHLNKGDWWGYIRCKDGRDGCEGRKGEKGEPGGPEGDKGDKGCPGDPGPEGDKGEKGETGMAGGQGEVGDNGEDGIDGNNGDIGPPGMAGLPGMNGTDGVDGDKGDPGDTGLSGPDVSVSGSAPSAYIHWGRSDCPMNASFVYNGSVAGPDSRIRGGAADFLCLPSSPVFFDDSTTSTIFISQVVGVRYCTAGGPLSGVNDEGVPCAMCVTPNRPTLMFPAATSCPDQWDEEYLGFLMSSEDFDASSSLTIDATRTKYICVNSAANGLTPAGSPVNACIAHVHANCPSQLLDCSGYNTLQLACVVCSKQKV